MAEVTGVAKDAKYGSLDEQPEPFVYGPLAQDWVGFVALIVETSGDPGAFTAGLRAIMRGLDPNLRVYEVRALEEYAAESLWKVRWQASLLGAFELLALVLAAVRLYGLSGAHGSTADARNRSSDGDGSAAVSNTTCMILRPALTAAWLSATTVEQSPSSIKACPVHSQT